MDHKKTMKSPLHKEVKFDLTQPFWTNQYK